MPLTVARLRQLAEIYGTTPDALLFPPSVEERVKRLRRADALLERMTDAQADSWLTAAETLIPGK